MAVPKKRTSYSRRNMRRAHDHLTPVNAVPCSNCHAYKLSHHICPSCGQYRGRSFVSSDTESHTH